MRWLNTINREDLTVRYLFRALPIATLGVLFFTDIVQAQRLGFVTGREPHGVDVYEMAMTPAVRKWQYPQSLYNFYQAN